MGMLAPRNERVVVIGKGAREHALAYRLSRDAENKVVREVVVVPGNDGMAFMQPCVKPDRGDLAGLVTLVKKIQPALVVVGPEDLLAQGLSDVLRSEGLTVFGPTQRATQIEASKAFMKQLAVESQIPTAAFATFTSEAAATEHLATVRYPVVIKADGLCAGKGVVVAQERTEALSAIKTLTMLGPIVIEEFLRGVEISAIALCTPGDALLFAPVRDHKRLLDHDQGPNTGGMGVVGPLPYDSKFMSRLKEKFFLPALDHMRRAGTPFSGALFAGLMVDGDDVRLLEFNARFGDPETQALMYGTDVDLFETLLAIAEGGTLEEMPLEMQPTAAITMAAAGYPHSSRLGDALHIPATCDGMIFMAGVGRNHSGQLITGGGRVLTCTARAESLRMAIRKSYDIVSHVSFEGAQYRTDIGQTLL